MHICIDARMIKNSGIGVYIYQYVNRLIGSKMFEITLLGNRTTLEGYFGHYNNWDCINAEFPIYSIEEQLKLPRLIPVCDIFWSPHYNIPLLPIRAKKHLVTIPDMAHLAFAKLLSPLQRLYANIVMRFAVKKANKILTISFFSKNEIIKYTGVRSDKVDVIYLGLDTKIFRIINDPIKINEVYNKYKLPERYLIFVGNVKPHKNLRKLVDAFSDISKLYPDLYLLIVGKKEGFITGDKELFEFIEDDTYLKERVRFTGYVELNDLPLIYGQADLFVFPSLYEGFGFPPLEAMACGCPAVVSSAASMPEICGDAVEYVNPNDSKCFVKTITKILDQPALRNELVEKGSFQFKKYNWQDSYNLFIHVIKNLQ